MIAALVCPRCGRPVTVGGRTKHGYCCPRHGPVDAIPRHLRAERAERRWRRIVGGWLAAACLAALLAWWMTL